MTNAIIKCDDRFDDCLGRRKMKLWHRKRRNVPDQGPKVKLKMDVNMSKRYWQEEKGKGLNTDVKVQERKLEANK